MNIYQHRGVDIVATEVEIRGVRQWLVTWKFPDEEDAVHVYRPTEAAALRYAKQQVNQFFDGAAAYPFPVMWRKGEDLWSGIDVENGVVPSDAVPVYMEYDE